MGVVGGLVIARWSWSLLRETSAVLLDGEVGEARRLELRRAVEQSGEARVVDLHVWRVGPRHLAAIVSVVTATPREPAHYRALLARFEDLAHLTIEVHAAQRP
jgi:Co/Zn/Cd efflux system component